MKKSIILFTFIMILTVQGYTIEIGNFFGKWKCQSEVGSIVIKILNETKAEVKLNKKITKDLSFEICYASIGVYPMFVLSWSESINGKQCIYTLSLLGGQQFKANEIKPVMKGFLDVEVVDENEEAQLSIYEIDFQNF